MYKIKQIDNRALKLGLFFMMWVQKKSMKRSPIPSPTHLLINHISEEVKMYYSERLVLIVHTSVYVKGLHHVSAEILIFHSEIYHLASAVPPKQVFVNIQQREAHLVVLVYQIKVFAYFPAK